VLAVLNAGDLPLEAFVSSPPVGPYYSVRFRADWVESVEPGTHYLADSLSLVYDEPNWIELPPAAVAGLGEAVRSIEPFPAPSITSVRLGGRPAEQPALYGGIFERLQPAELPLGSDRLRLFLRSKRPTPWTQHAGLIEVAPGLGLVRRDGEWFRLPAALAETVRRDAGLVRASPPPPAASFPWGPVLGGALGGAGLLGAALLAALRRRGRGPLAAQ
jgi:hypothetical protein